MTGSHDVTTFETMEEPTDVSTSLLWFYFKFILQFVLGRFIFTVAMLFNLDVFLVLFLMNMTEVSL